MQIKGNTDVNCSSIIESIIKSIFGHISLVCVCVCVCVGYLFLYEGNNKKMGDK